MRHYRTTSHVQPATQRPTANPTAETRILLLRHAETAAPDRFHGAESDVGLSPRGLAQAEDVARRLTGARPEALYCSAMRRARETATPIGLACGLVPSIIEALHERVMGPLSGTLHMESRAIYDETRQRWESGELDATHPGGESYRAIRDRVIPAFLALAARHPGGTAVVVAHGVVIRVLITSLAVGRTPADFGAVRIDHTGVHDLRHDGIHWREAGDLPMIGLGRVG